MVSSREAHVNGNGVDGKLPVMEVECTESVADTKGLCKLRYLFAALSLLGVSVLYILRVNLSVAIVAMVNNTQLEVLEGDEEAEDECPGELSEPHTQYSGEFLWDQEQQAQVLAAFYYGYAASQMAGGVLAERWGGGPVFGWATLLTAGLTLLTPWSVWAGRGILWGNRLLQGLAQGLTFPAMQSMISQWAPPQERSRFSIIFSGSYLGTALCLPASGILCSSPVGGGWPMVFYVTGGVGVVWWILWKGAVGGTPAQQRGITENERRYIEAAVGELDSRPRPVPWRSLFVSRGLWACSAMHFGIGWNFFGPVTYLPSFMATAMHYRMSDNTLLSAIPFVLGGVFSVTSSFLLDYLIKRKLVTRLTGYKIFNGITAVGGSLTMLFLPLAGCQRTLINALLAVNGLCIGAQYCGNGSNLLVLAPRYAGITYGFSNTWANLAGIGATWAVGVLTAGGASRHHWDIMFYLSAGVGIVTFLLYLLLCTAEEEPWNSPEGTRDKEPQTNGNQHINEGFEGDIVVVRL